MQMHESDGVFSHMPAACALAHRENSGTFARLPIQIA